MFSISDSMFSARARRRKEKASAREDGYRGGGGGDACCRAQPVACSCYRRRSLRTATTCDSQGSALEPWGRAASAAPDGPAVADDIMGDSTPSRRLPLLPPRAQPRAPMACAPAWDVGVQVVNSSSCKKTWGGGRAGGAEHHEQDADAGARVVERR